MVRSKVRRKVGPTGMEVQKELTGYVEAWALVGFVERA